MSKSKAIAEAIAEAIAKAVIAMLGMMVGCGVLASTALAHDAEILGCNKNLPVTSVKKVGEWVMPNGLYAEAYDRNDDGVGDIVALSAITGYEMDGEEVRITHAEHPTFYLVDLDFEKDADGKTHPEVVYVDKFGRGNCEDIVLYEDLTAPRGNKPRGGKAGLSFHGRELCRMW